MKKQHLHFTLRIALVALVFSFAAKVSARHFSYHAPNYRMVKVEFAPVASIFGNTSGSSYTTELRAPISMPILFDGGDHGGRGHDGDGDDTLNPGDTGRGPGPDDTLHHDGPGDGDTSHHGGPGRPGGPDDGDTTGGGIDTGHCDHGGDTTGLGGPGRHGDGDGNDTVRCHGGRGHDDDDTTATNDSSEHPMFGGSHQSIVVRTGSPKATINFVFTNNLATSVRLTSITLANGRNFSIVSGAPSMMKPASLAAGASITLKIAFNSSDNAIHTDQLIATTTSNQILNTISLEGQATFSAASVSNSLPAGVTVTSYPNPVTSYLKVDLTGAISANVQIFDARGNQVLSSSLASSEWIWNGTSTDGSILPAGTYIVHLSGTSASNEAFISTEKIILAR